MNNRVTVLICTYNRGSLINDTLDSLINHQTNSPDEIVVVNGGGELNCSSTLEKWKARFSSLKVINTENKNLSCSRNVGLHHCTGDLILQTDDDARPFPDWIEKMIYYHVKYPKVGVLGGNVIDYNDNKIIEKIADLITFPYYPNEMYVRSVAGVNCSYKKEVVRQVGQYDEDLFRGEDVDYNWRALLCGWKVLAIPDIKVYHINRPNWMGLFNQQFMYGRAHYLVSKKWPEMYSHYPRKIQSIKSLLKWIASWTIIPFDDSIRKTNGYNMQINGFDILIIFFINIINRVGTMYQRCFR